MSFNDQFSKQAKDYAKFRPEYPRELFEFLAKIAPSHDLAWDGATGNGQSARGLKPFFRQVEATDASAEQIANAEPLLGVRYRVAMAEDCGLADASVDLITVATALHWLDLDRFYSEVKRVLKPGGIVAVWAYGGWEKGETPDAISKVFRRFSREIVGPYFAPELKKLWNGYRELPFPFKEIAAPEFAIRVDWTMDEVLGCLLTWSKCASCTLLAGRSGFASCSPLYTARLPAPRGLNPGLGQRPLRASTLPA